MNVKKCFTFCIICMLHNTAREYSCVMCFHSALTHLSNSINSIKEQGMGNGKYGVALERSDYRTLEIGEGEKCHSAPLTQPCPDWLSV